MKLRSLFFLAAALFSLAWTPALGQTVRVEDVHERRHECTEPVENRRDAARCFTAYFEEQLGLLREQRGIMPTGIGDLYRPVTEEDVLFRRGNYQIIRDGCLSPYFINDGFIYLDLH